MTVTKRLLITPGEPAGIGPDITLQIAQQDWPAELIVIADPILLTARAKQLGLAITLLEADLSKTPTPHQSGTLKMIPVTLKAPCQAGVLSHANASYVIETLTLAADLCQRQKADAIVTGPVHKANINQAGIPFTGHTEFFATHAQIARTVMLFVVDDLKVALVTTHLPLADVSKAITKAHLTATLSVLQSGLTRYFQIASPRILVAGLNPHAGEEGHLGREEIEIITPVLNTLRQQGYQLEGPLPADTIFTPAQLKKGDVVLAMYHDQALPLVKYLGFDHAVNVTLGLPYLRTSVDHGTALSLAGTGHANAGSMKAALALAAKLTN